MRILHVSVTLGRGGAEHMLYKLLSVLNQQVYSSAVVSMTPGGIFARRIMALGVPVMDLGMRASLPNPLALLRLRRAIARFRPHLIQSWMYHANAFVSVARYMKLVNTPVVWNIRHSLVQISDEDPSTRLAIRVGAKASADPYWIVYNSHTAMVQHSALGYRADRSEVIPNGFDCAVLKPDAQARRRMRAVLGIEPHQIAVVHIARFHPMKDHRLFLQAALQLADDPRFVFVLAGSGVALGTPFFAQYMTEPFGSKCRFLGERDDVPDLLNAADIVCLSSSYGEGFPNVVGEAMAVGTPCVVTDVGDAAYIVGETGLVVPRSQPTNLTKAILTLANEPDETKALRGQRARNRIERLFSLTAVATRFETLYHRFQQASADCNRSSRMTNAHKAS